MLKSKGIKVVALMLVMLLALSGNVMGALAEQAAGGEIQIAEAMPVDAPPAGHSVTASENASEPEALSESEVSSASEAPSEQGADVPSEKPVEPETPAESMNGGSPVTAGSSTSTQRIVYTIKFLDPDGEEYFVLEVEEYERLEEPLFTPVLMNHTFAYWYEEVPVDPDRPALGMTEAKVKFDVAVDRDYVVYAKLVEIPMEEKPEPQANPSQDDARKAPAGTAGGGEDKGGEPEAAQQGEEESLKQTREARRDQREQSDEMDEVIGARTAGEIISLDDLEIVIIPDTDPILEGDDAQKGAIEEDDEAETTLEDDEVVIADDEEADELNEEETEDVIIDEESDEEETGEITVEDEEAGEAGELDMEDDQVPLAGWAVNVYTNHKPLMLEGETLEVWGELIGFDNVNVITQWQFAGEDGVWHDMPGANDLSYAVAATNETVNYTWRLAVALAK